MGDDREANFGERYWRSAPAYPAEAPSAASSLDAAEFRVLADNLPTLCWIANGDGYIVWYNRRWHEYCGTTPEQMEGWGWTAVHDPDVLPAVMERWTGAVAGGEPFEMTFPLRGADGRYRPFLTRVQPVRAPDGRVVRWFGVNTDVSKQAEADAALRQERDRSRDVLEHMGDGFALLDRDFRVLQEAVYDRVGVAYFDRILDEDDPHVVLKVLLSDRRGKIEAALQNAFEFAALSGNRFVHIAFRREKLDADALIADLQDAGNGRHPLTEISLRRQLTLPRAPTWSWLWSKDH